MVAAASLEATQQLGLFDAEPKRVGEIDRVKRAPQGRKPRKATAYLIAKGHEDYGRGICELSTTGRSKIAYRSLSDRKKIGALAHIAYERATKQWCRKNKANFIASGLSFGEWFSLNKESHDLTMKNWSKAFGWINGWWNKAPLGSKPKMNDKTILKLLEEKLKENDER